MSYKVSVVVPVYNAQEDLVQAIDSVINQTLGFENIEFILVDDASTDRSREIIRNYQKNHDNIKLVELEKNSGLPGKPRSIGMDYATADYIIFLDTDDSYQSDAFEVFYDSIEKEKSDVVIASHYINLDGDMVNANLIETDDNIVSLNPMKSQKNFDRLSYNHFVAPWGKIFRKEVIVENNIRFPEDSLCEDAYFYFKFLINSNKVTILPKQYLYVYNVFENKQTAIHGHDMKKLDNFIRGMGYVMELLKNVNFSINVFLDENISSLLLIFSNLKKEHKTEAVLKIYDLEKDLDINVSRKEISILNNLILKKQFKRAIFVSNCYSMLYNNSFIKNIYKKMNNK